METVIKAERSTLGMLRLVGPCGCSIEVVPRLAYEHEPATMARWDALVDHLTQRTPCVAVELSDAKIKTHAGEIELPAGTLAECVEGHPQSFHDAVCTGPGRPAGFTCSDPSHAPSRKVGEGG